MKIYKDKCEKKILINGVDLSDFKVGDVIKSWDDDKKKADYEMIVADKSCLDYRFALMPLNMCWWEGVINEWKQSIPELIAYNISHYKHVEKVDFRGVDAGKAK